MTELSESLRLFAEVLKRRAEHLRGEYQRMQPTDVMTDVPVVLLEKAAIAAQRDYEEECARD